MAHTREETRSFRCAVARSAATNWPRSAWILAGAHPLQQRILGTIRFHIHCITSAVGVVNRHEETKPTREQALIQETRQKNRQQPGWLDLKTDGPSARSRLLPSVKPPVDQSPSSPAPGGPRNGKTAHRPAPDPSQNHPSVPQTGLGHGQAPQIPISPPHHHRAVHDSRQPHRIRHKQRAAYTEPAVGQRTRNVPGPRTIRSPRPRGHHNRGGRHHPAARQPATPVDGTARAAAPTGAQPGALNCRNPHAACVGRAVRPPGGGRRRLHTNHGVHRDTGNGCAYGRGGRTHGRIQPANHERSP